MKSYLLFFFRNNPLRNIALILTVLFFIWMLVLAILPASRFYEDAVLQIENKGLFQKTTDYFFGAKTPDQIAHSMKQREVFTMFWLTVGCGLLAAIFHLMSFFWFRVLFVYAVLTGFSAIYDTLPIDFVPNFIPFLGGFDNAFLDAGGDTLGISYVVWQISRRVRRKEAERQQRINDILSEHETDQNTPKMVRKLMLTTGERSLEGK